MGFNPLRSNSVTDNDSHPFYIHTSKTGARDGYSTLDSAREALLAWILLQRQAGEHVIETDTGQWKDSQVTRWIADRDDKIIRLDP
jgi:hypothetical protein